MRLSTRGLISCVLAGALLGGALPFSAAGEEEALEPPLEEVTMHPESSWELITDQVMGGVSTGSLTFGQEDGKAFARLTGNVSTENRGGFIQIRHTLSSPASSGTTGVRLVVRGNGQRYFVHLRTSGTILPWQYYQAEFTVTEGWSEVRLPFDAFAASGALLRSVPRADSLKSVAVVAFGRDHDAQIDVREVGFY